MWREIVLVIALVELVCGASLVPCPEDCSCSYIEEQLEATCDSFDFLNKILPKQTTAIISLKINSTIIEAIHPKLKYLRNLKSLDISGNNVILATFPSLPKLKKLNLSGNKLKQINFSVLPSTLEHVDISSNFIAHIQKEWTSFKSLKVLHLSKNLINCDCEAVLVYKQLLKSEVSIPETVLCHDPKEYQGKSLDSVNCSIADIMLDDGSNLEGSGAEDISETEETVNIPLDNEEGDLKKVDDLLVYGDTTSKMENEMETLKPIEEEEQTNKSIELEEDENEFLPSENINSSLNETDEVEGSGDEGSGFWELPKACIVNCSTLKPVGIDDEEHASTPPNVLEQGKIILEDINLFKEDATTTTEPPATTLFVHVTKPVTSSPPEVVTEPIIYKEVNPVLYKEFDKDAEIVPTNDTVPGEMERASVAASPGNNTTTFYAIVGVILLALIIGVVYLIQRKNKNAQAMNNRRGNIMENGQEMKPLNHKPVEEKPVIKDMDIPENTPLLNGNGKLADEKVDHETKTESSIPNDETEDQEDNVEYRQKSELLTPQRERVTIKETELPDSIPKTPLLIQRQRNSAGEIITVVPT